jgi:hypothetical protein
VLILTLGLGTSQLFAAQTQTLDLSASAYGTNVFVGNTIVSGKTAPSNVGCTPQIGVNKNNSIASVSLFPTLTTGAVTSSAGTFATGSTATSDVAGINLLAGLVTADELKSVSTTTQDSAGLHTSAAGSVFTKLLVAGIPVGDNPAPNTVLSLPLFGSVTLNEQTSSVNGTTAKLTVNMIHIKITLVNLLGIQVGTEIIVGNAQSSITLATTPAILDGTAYGSQITVTPLVVSGPSAVATVPCLGSKGQIISNTTAGINVLGELVTGTVADTAQGAISSSSASSNTTSTVQAANLVNALLAADVITAAANASTPDGQNFTFTDTGSTFLNLVVAGHPEINDQVAPNTRVSILGIGTLWLHRIIQTPNNIEVRMVELVVNQNNSLGLPIGTDIRIADASASLHSNTQP